MLDRGLYFINHDRKRDITRGKKNVEDVCNLCNLGCYSTLTAGLGSAGEGLGLAETLPAGVSLSPGLEKWEWSQTP